MAPAAEVGPPMKAAPWELGSEFHWQEFPPAAAVPWPRPAVWYALGRHAVSALIAKLRTRRLWLPDFFCCETLPHFRAAAELRFYADDPRWPQPRWETLRPGKRDLVLAVNYFGGREGAGWREWQRRTGCLLLEDHSHDPGSPWAAHSTADYAFCSVRKTLPVPDGGMLWSPRGRALPPAPAGEGALGASLKLAAMVLKAAYLAGSVPLEIKAEYRRLQREGERMLAAAPVAPPSAYTRQYAVAGGAPRSWRRRRERNARALLAAMQDRGPAEPLFHDWPRGSAPLCLPLVFRSPASREQWRRRLLAHNIYCAVHWPAPSRAPGRVRELAARILSIPCDHRYDRADMARIAAVLWPKQ